MRKFFRQPGIAAAYGSRAWGKIRADEVTAGRAAKAGKGQFYEAEELAGSSFARGRLRRLAARAQVARAYAWAPFLDQRDGGLYAGDALMTIEEVRLPFDPAWFFPLPKWATWHSETAVESVQRFLDLDFTRILPGHGSAVENPREALERALARARRKLKS